MNKLISEQELKAAAHEIVPSLQEYFHDLPELDFEVSSEHKAMMASLEVLYVKNKDPRGGGERRESH